MHHLTFPERAGGSAVYTINQPNFRNFCWKDHHWAAWAKWNGWRLWHHCKRKSTCLTTALQHQEKIPYWCYRPPHHSLVLLGMARHVTSCHMCYQAWSKLYQLLLFYSLEICIKINKVEKDKYNIRWQLLLQFQHYFFFSLLCNKMEITWKKLKDQHIPFTFSQPWVDIMKYTKLTTKAVFTWPVRYSKLIWEVGEVLETLQ